MFFRRTIEKRLKKIAILVGIFIPLISFSQANIPTGSWRTHYSYNSTISVSQSLQEIFAASASGLFIVNKEDKSISTLTKLNGLSETGITLINYNSSTNTLLISYDNGQIDLLSDNQITSIPDIKLSDIFKSKISHHANPIGNYSFLSTDFGLVQIDTEANLIIESFLNLSSTGDNLIVYASTIYNDSLFLATEEGIMAGSLSENLKDFTKWKRFPTIQETTKVIALYNGKPISGNSSKGLIKYENGNWNALGELIGTNLTSIETYESKTVITGSGKVFELQNNKAIQIESSHIIQANNAIPEGNNFWIADSQNGLVKINGNSNESIYPNGPFFNNIINLKSIHNKIFALPEFQYSNGLPIRNNFGFSIFENGIWNNYNSTGQPNTNSIPEFKDITSVSSLSTGEIVFSSFGYGLLIWDDDNFSFYDEANSPLINSSPPERNVLIADIDTDNTNLWALNNKTNSSVQVLQKDRSWATLTPSNKVAEGIEITSTPWGDQWIAINSMSDGGIVVLNSTGAETYLTSSGIGTIPSNSINQIIRDREDKIWIATKKGVVYYLYPYSILEDPSQEAIVPIIDSRLLFSNENVNCLAVDGGNRIWMGTNEGAWLFAHDGSELVEHFTTENSPLLSDVVLNIAIDNSSGEVFFNTDKGLISYRGSGTITGTYTKPKIFPNPVNPNFTGVITIEGVPTNSDIKITDSSGRLVAKIKANGNTAIWDMNNEYLMQVVTGVYFVFISSKDGTQTQIGKIAIVN